MNATRRPEGRSGSDAAVRGALLIGVAVVIGLLLLWQGHDDDDAVATTGPGSDTTEPADDGSTDETVPEGGDDTATTAPTVPTASTNAPMNVQVLVANGTGTAGGAGAVTAKLQPKGYATLPPADASTSDVVASRVYYREGFAEDAKQIARDLAVPEPVDTIIEPMPEPPPVKGTQGTASAQLANVLVLLGSDLVIKQV
jgi:hypothetical protein